MVFLVTGLEKNNNSEVFYEHAVQATLKVKVIQSLTEA
jgi:hypothetical protein